VRVAAELTREYFIFSVLQVICMARLVKSYTELHRYHTIVELSNE